jgi:hypothetical protein
MFAVVLASGFVIGAPALKDTPKEDAPSPGRWEVESHEIDGFALARVPVTLTRRSLEMDYSAASRKEGRIVTWRVSFFRVAAGRQVEVAHSAYEWTPAAIQKGIWKVEGDRLTICTGKPGGSRPTEYSGAVGSGQTLIVLVRIGD